MMTVMQKQVLSSDGIHQLKGRVYLPDGKPKGYLHVVHGMCEYIGRYDRFMKEMCEAGYIVFGYDHLGHGETALEGELGYIAASGGWQHLVADVGVFYKAVKAEYGDLPYLLFGHSMGSFIVRLAAVDLPVKRLVVMGTGGPNPAAGLGIRLTKAIKRMHGDRYISPMIDKIAFGAYNKRCPGDGKYGWLTKDGAVRDCYADDRFCNYMFTASAMQDLMELTTRCNLSEWFERAPSCPILLISGSEDPVGNYGKGVKAVHQRLILTGKTVTLSLYPTGRHEILNDDTHDRVVSEILAFLQ